MIQGISKKERIEFVSSFDDTEPKTVFVMRPLSGIEMLSVYSVAGGGTNQIIEGIKKSVIEIKGVEDKESFIDDLPFNVLNELMEKFNDINTLTDNDKKK
jgi:hypothetical protein